MTAEEKITEENQDNQSGDSTLHATRLSIPGKHRIEHHTESSDEAMRRAFSAWHSVKSCGGKTPGNGK